jgi:hypothetical protein
MLIDPIQNILCFDFQRTSNYHIRGSQFAHSFFDAIGNLDEILFPGLRHFSNPLLFLGY